MKGLLGSDSRNEKPQGQRIKIRVFRLLYLRSSRLLCTDTWYKRENINHTT